VESAAIKMMGTGIPIMESTVTATVSLTINFPINNEGDKVIAQYISMIQNSKEKLNGTSKISNANAN
jgi:hypothetical protein